MPAVSIIVPVYNVEKYLKRCVDSLLSQTFSDFELILVDDGSTDSSGAMCDAFADSDWRVMVIHKQNEGLSQARNTGLNVVHGDFVIFLDSDDWFEVNMLQVLVGAAKRTRAEVAVCGYYIDFVDEGHTVQKKLAAHSCLGAEDIRRGVLEIEKNGMFNVVWNKLYKKSAVEGLSFDPDGMPGEDLLFNCEVFSRIRSLAVVEACCVHYRKLDKISLSCAYMPDMPERVHRFVAARMWLYETLGINDEEGRKTLAKTTAEYYFTCVPNVYRAECDLKAREKVEFFKRLFAKDGLRAAAKVATFDKKDINMQIFVRLIGKPKTANLVYTLLFFLRKKASTLYKFYRKTISN